MKAGVYMSITGHLILVEIIVYDYNFNEKELLNCIHFEDGFWVDLRISDAVKFLSAYEYLGEL